MPSKDTIKLEFNHINIKNRISFQKSDKEPFVIYADLECLMEKIDRCINSVEHSFTKKYVNLFHQVFQCLQYHRFKNKENKHDVYRGKDCLKFFFESFKEHVMNIINFKQ